MPMSGDVLGPQIASALQGLSETEKQDVAAIWKKIATLIITHIQTQGVVNTTGGGGPATGTIA